MSGMNDFSPDDLYLHQQITGLHCAPGIDAAAAGVRSIDRGQDQYISCIWVFPLAGNAPRQLTRGPGRDKMPQWSPDGKQIAFISDRAGTPQLYAIPCDGGEARQVGEFELGVTQLRWAKDGRSLWATVALRVDPELRGKRGEPPAQAHPAAPEVCWRLPYKSDGVGYLLRREIHLFNIDLASGEARQITDGAFDVQAFQPSANGKHIAYSRTREGRYAHCTDLWVCDSDGSRHRRLSQQHAMVMAPIWSPDSRWLAFSGAIEEGDGQTGLWLLEFATGRTTPLGPAGLEVADTENLHWSADSRSLCSRVPTVAGTRSSRSRCRAENCARWWPVTGSSARSAAAANGLSIAWTPPVKRANCLPAASMAWASDRSASSIRGGPNAHQ